MGLRTSSIGGGRGGRWVVASLFASRGNSWRCSGRPAPQWLMLPDPPELRGPVVVLRPLRADDAGAIVTHCQDPEIGRWTTVPYPYGRSDAGAFLNSGEWALGICDAGTNALAGCIGVMGSPAGESACEVGYWVGSAMRRRGLATAALGTLTGWLVGTCGLGRVELLILPGNTASEGVATAAGFTRAGRARGRRVPGAVLWVFTAAADVTSERTAAVPGGGGDRF